MSMHFKSLADYYARSGPGEASSSIRRPCQQELFDENIV
jgi:hypothetical protein